MNIFNFDVVPLQKKNFDVVYLTKHSNEFGLTTNELRVS